MKKLFLIAAAIMAVVCTSCDRNKAVKYIPEDALAVVVMDPAASSEPANSKEIKEASKSYTEKQLNQIKAMSAELGELVEKLMEDPQDLGLSLTQRMFAYCTMEDGELAVVVLLPVADADDFEKNSEVVLNVLKKEAGQNFELKEDGDIHSFDFGPHMPFAMGWNDDMLAIVVKDGQCTADDLKNRLTPAKKNITEVKDFKEFLGNVQLLSAWMSVEKVAEVTNLKNGRELKPLFEIAGNNALDKSAAHFHMGCDAKKGTVDMHMTVQFKELIDNIDWKKFYEFSENPMALYGNSYEPYDYDYDYDYEMVDYDEDSADFDEEELAELYAALAAAAEEYED